MPEFNRPPLLGDHPFAPDVAQEIAKLRAHREARNIPERAADRLLLATWNVANFDVQDREPAHLELIAEMVSWFDVVALQEVRDDLSGMRHLKTLLPDSWRMVFSEAGGNDERQAFVWNSDSVQLGEKIGKLAVPRPQLENAFGSDISAFDRTPYIVSFIAGKLTLVLVGVHSYFGKGKDAMPKRVAETRAIAWWCDKRRKDPQAYSRDIIALGDFNMPKARAGDPVFDELTERGLRVPEYESRIGTDTTRARQFVELEAQGERVPVGSTISSDSQYDQFVIAPEHTGVDIVGRPGVFDFDAVLFSTLWKALPWPRTRPTKHVPEVQRELDYDSYVRWAISDHRPLWLQLRTG